MAKFKAEIPTNLINAFKSLETNTDKMLEEMTKAGADVVANNMQGLAPEGLSDKIKVTRSYKTPSDGGVNTKVYISGYFINRNGKETPAPLVANMFEYGSSKREYPKRPFLRRSFRKSQIEQAMKKVQDKYIKE